MRNDVTSETQSSTPGAARPRAAVLLDLDGTLTNSAPGILTGIANTLAFYGHYPARETLYQYLGPPLGTAFIDFLPPAQVNEAVERYREGYAAVGLYDCTLYDGVREMLQTLQVAGFVVCLATSKPKHFATTILQHFGLLSYFAYVGGAMPDNTLSTKAEVITDVLAQPCVQGRRAVMVGDRFYDLVGAQLCNLPAIAVLYGYGARAEFEAYAPTFIAETPQNLCEHLLAQY